MKHFVLAWLVLHISCVTSTIEKKEYPTQQHDNQVDVDIHSTPMSFTNNHGETRNLSQLPSKELIYFYGEALARDDGRSGKWMDNVQVQLQKLKTNTSGQYYGKSVQTTDANGVFESLVSSKSGGVYRLRIPPTTTYDIDLVETYAVVPHDKGDGSTTRRIKFNHKGYSPPFRAQRGDAIYVRVSLVPDNTFRIKGFVWHDTNQNGIQDDDESPFEGAHIRLSRTRIDPKRTERQSFVVSKVETGVNGTYEMKERVAMDVLYTLSIQVEGRYSNKLAFTRRIVEEYNLLDNDSDVDPNGKVDRIKVTSGDSIEIDAGVVERDSMRCVEGVIWRDGGNGWRNDRERTLPYAVVTLEHYSGYPNIVTKMPRDRGIYQVCTYDPRPSNALHSITVSKTKYSPTQQLNPENFAKSSRDSDIDPTTGRSLWFHFDDVNSLQLDVGMLRSDLQPVGSSCVDDSTCITGYCYHDSSDTEGLCTCNPKDNMGCSGDYECASSEEIQLAERSTGNHPPTCFLPPRAPCTVHSECLTDFCEVTFTCAACNPKTGYPCGDVGGSCRIVDGSYECLVCPTSTTSSGRFLDYPYEDDDDDNDNDYECDFPRNRKVWCGGCSYGNQCLASLASSEFTNETCENSECPGSNTNVAFPDYDSLSEAAFCPYSVAPVDCNGCVYANQCLASVHHYSPDSCRPHVTVRDCPHPMSEESCTLSSSLDNNIDEAVVCNGCEYPNQCTATGVNSNFTVESCKRIADCPPVTHVSDDENHGMVCPRIVLPVDCDGCLYLNQCDATKASASFTPERCSRLEGGSCPLVPSTTTCNRTTTTTPPTDDEAASSQPVRCSGCVYHSQCEATAADPTFVSETCSRFVYQCPPPAEERNCTDGDVMNCLGCKYFSQCDALWADPLAFTPDTCHQVDPCPLPKPNACRDEQQQPVRCFGCVYHNVCEAMSASSRYSEDICYPLQCPPTIPFSKCMDEDKKIDDQRPVTCFGCRYDNLCEATWAEPQFTAQTCISV